MKHPQEYVDFLHSFLEGDLPRAKVEGLNREDWVCLVMAAHTLELPVDIHLANKLGPKTVILIRKGES